MMFSTTTFAAVFTALLSVSNAHMLLNRPARFPAGGELYNSPLVGPGAGASDYPCKVSSQWNAYAFDFERTKIPLGSNYTIQFQGGATHGGGSCQFSLSKDLEPNKGSTFKVIHSTEGGCPVRNNPGNIGDSASAMDPDEYPITFPADLEPGDYTFAWTWFNKVGNREMYMSCAPITLTGGQSSKRTLGARASSSFDSLPNLFLANIPDVECASPPDGDGSMKFPDPGSSLEVIQNDLNPPVGNAQACYAPPGKAAAYSPGSGSGSSTSAVAGTPSPTPTPTPSQSLYTPKYAPTYPPTSAAPSPTASPYYPYQNSTGPTATGSYPQPTAGSGTSGSCPSGQVSCPSPGSVVCMGSSQFGICNQMNCAVPQQLAAGTHCSNGQIMRKRNVLNSSVERSKRRRDFQKQNETTEEEIAAEKAEQGGAPFIAWGGENEKARIKRTY